MNDEPEIRFPSRTVVFLLVGLGLAAALCVTAIVVLFLVLGGTAAALGLSLLAVLIGVAALAFARYDEHAAGSRLTQSGGSRRSRIPCAR